MFLKGIKLEREKHKTLPAKLELVDEHTARLTICEGKYHQVKRMMEAVGNPLLHLHRSRFADWVVGDLKPGEWRPFHPDERAQLIESCGLASRPS